VPDGAQPGRRHLPDFPEDLLHLAQACSIRLVGHERHEFVKQGERHADGVAHPAHVPDDAAAANLALSARHPLDPIRILHDQSLPHSLCACLPDGSDSAVKRV